MLNIFLWRKEPTRAKCLRPIEIGTGPRQQEAIRGHSPLGRDGPGLRICPASVSSAKAGREQRGVECGDRKHWAAVRRTASIADCCKLSVTVRPTGTPEMAARLLKILGLPQQI